MTSPFDIKAGGQAFPLAMKFADGTTGFQFGMTLRDYFAAKAMQSMNSRPDYKDAPADAIALDAYDLADAMLKARDASS